MSVVFNAEEEAYKAFVKWLSDAQDVRRMFLEADLPMPRALELLFQDTKGDKRLKRKRITKTSKVRT